MPDSFAVASSVALIVIVVVLLRRLFGNLVDPLADSPAEKLEQEIQGFLQSVDLTSPNTRNVAIMVVTIPDYGELCERFPLAESYSLMNRYYEVVSEQADSRRGEISGLAGAEIFVMFGRILPVEQPMQAAAATALGIVERLKASLPEGGEAARHCAGPAVAIGYGEVLSGPLGRELRRTYTTVGPVIDQTFRLARATPAGQVRALASLEVALSSDFDLEQVEGTTGACLRVVRPRETAPQAE